MTYICDIVFGPPRGNERTVTRDEGEGVVDVAVFSQESGMHNIPGAGQNAKAKGTYLRACAQRPGNPEVVQVESELTRDQIALLLADQESTWAYVPLSAGCYESVVQIQKATVLGVLRSHEQLAKYFS